VRGDLERHLNVMVPEDAPHYEHTLEGPDDMPAHIKASLFGSGLTIPVGRGELLLGTWQGIYLCEHRNHGGSRRVVATLFGRKRQE
jgi:secondary thiamine-phosphate synthase enzyme